jgi:hypothetical protein
MDIRLDFIDMVSVNRNASRYTGQHIKARIYFHILGRTRNRDHNLSEVQNHAPIDNASTGYFSIPNAQLRLKMEVFHENVQKQKWFPHTQYSDLFKSR